MSHKSKYVTESGIDVVINTKTGKEELKGDRTLEFVLTPDDSPTGFGKTATPKATAKMINDQIIDDVLEILGRKENNGKSEAEMKQIILNEFETKRIATEFGKESLLRILSQEDCIGIRFTTCKSISGKSIVAVGITEEKNAEGMKISVPLKKEFFINAGSTNQSSSTLELAPLSEEEGVGATTKKVLSDMGKNLEEFVSELDLSKQASIELFGRKITTTFFGIQ